MAETDETTGDPPEVEQAIRDIQSGEDPEGGAEVIYYTYWEVVYRFFRRRGFSPEKAEDLTQDAFFRVFRNMATYEHRGKFAAWLFSIADNVCKAEWERCGTKKRSGIEIPYDESPGDRENGDGGDRLPSHAESVAPTQEEELGERELRARFQSAIEELPPRQRECLTLRLEGFTYRQIATALRITRETVKQHLAAARRRLRELLQDVDLPDIEEAGA